MDDVMLMEAHSHSINHRAALEQDSVCGCFHCLKIFSPDEIKTWIKDISGTAVCPYCGMDAVIGQNSGFEITAEFLAAMKARWFGASS